MWHDTSIFSSQATVPSRTAGALMKRVVVIGAGAAGTMAAIFAARAGAETVLVERTRDGGRKILVSGGGRCNVLPARLDEARFVTDSSPNTLRKMVRSWPLAEQRAFFEDDLGIPLAEELESAKLFPRSNRARDVRDGLLEHAQSLGARLLMNTRVIDVAPEGTGWRVSCEDAPPLTGSDGAGLRILERLGHVMHPTYAALTPVTAEPAPYGDLAGVSLRVTLSARGGGRSSVASGGFLFTHRGYSGPSVLDVSHVVVRSRAEGTTPPAEISACWTENDASAWEAMLRPQAGRTAWAVVRAELPDRLAAALLDDAQVEQSRLLGDLTRDERRRLLDVLVRGDLPWTGDEGYKKAEVTGGGVSLAEIDPRTMESRRQPGLFLCGEVLDAFGPIGGYNFLWSWATGRAAGRGAAGTK